MKSRFAALLLSIAAPLAAGCSDKEEVYIPTETPPLQDINVEERPSESQGRGFREKGG